LILPQIVSVGALAIFTIGFMLVCVKLLKPRRKQ
jgi:hypothetical protein